MMFQGSSCNMNDIIRAYVIFFTDNRTEVVSQCGQICRFTAHYTVRMGQGELRKQWTWEPMMSNSLMLSLVDPNDVMFIHNDCVEFSKKMIVCFIFS